MQGIGTWRVPIEIVRGFVVQSMDRSTRLGVGGEIHGVVHTVEATSEKQAEHWT